MSIRRRIAIAVGAAALAAGVIVPAAAAPAAASQPPPYTMTLDTLGYPFCATVTVKWQHTKVTSVQFYEGETSTWMDGLLGRHWEPMQKVTVSGHKANGSLTETVCLRSGVDTSMRLTGVGANFNGAPLSGEPQASVTWPLNG